jgi:lysophospholipase L1-like esterase
VLLAPIWSKTSVRGKLRCVSKGEKSRDQGLTLQHDSILVAFALALAPSFAGCAEAAPKLKQSDEVSLPSLVRPTSVPAATAAAAPTPASPPPTPAEIENPEALRGWFEALADLRARKRNSDVVVSQFGDSHTAADYETGQIRRALQAAFGDGGRGHVAVGMPYKGYRQEGVLPRVTHDFEGERYKRKSDNNDGYYGLLGVALAGNKRAAAVKSDFVAPFATFELSYLQKPRGGTFDVWLDGKPQGSTRTSGKEVALRTLSLNASQGPHEVEVRLRGDGDVRLLGVTLDSPSVGLVYDALGINGARASGLLNTDDAHFNQALRGRRTDLVVLAFGTNEAVDDAPIETHARAYAEVLGRIARALPEASCLLLGPPDMAADVNKDTSKAEGKGSEKWAGDSAARWEPLPRLREIIAMQRSLAKAARCAFYDQQLAMGGEGTMHTWVMEERANRDHVHLTKDSYVALGNQFAQALLRAFEKRASPPPLPSSP